MGKLKRVRRDNLTIISNVFLRDANLSLQAKGLLTLVMAFTDDDEFTISGISKYTREGFVSISKILDELRSNGYYDGVCLYEEPQNISEQRFEQCKLDLGVEETQVDDDEGFIDKIYKMYPSKCPKRNASLGKCKKDKDRIKKLLKQYTKEDIEKVVANEVDTKLGKEYMQNFSTFLNNFPDPSLIDGCENRETMQTKDTLIIGGVEYK